MKKILIILFVLLCAFEVYANDGAVFLELDKRKDFVVPSIKEECLAPTNQDGEIVDKEIDYSTDLGKDSEVFESKVGQAFEKFINNKVVDKKFNIFSTATGKTRYNEINNY